MIRRAALVVAVLVAVLVPATKSSALVTFSAGTRFTDGAPLCGVAAAPIGATAVTDDGVLKVATLNLLHSETDEGDRSLGERLPLLADAIAQSGADIVGAQEVARNVDFDAKSEYPQRHGLVVSRFAAAIATRTGQSWQWCWSRSNPHVPLSPDVQVGGGNALDDLAAQLGNFPDSGSFSEGVAILTRFKISASKFRRMLPRSYEAPFCLSGSPFCPLDANFDSRQVLWARVITPRGGGVDMFTTHIAHGLTQLSTATKQLQVRQAIEVTRRWATPDALPDFLVGDFNSSPESAAMRTMRVGGFVDTFSYADGAECTAARTGACSGGPTDGQETYTKGQTRSMSERIDYVLARRPVGCHLSVADSHLIANTPTRRTDGRWTWPSDHYGFVSTVSTNCALS